MKISIAGLALAAACATLTLSTPAGAGGKAKKSPAKKAAKKNAKKAPAAGSCNNLPGWRVSHCAGNLCRTGQHRSGSVWMASCGPFGCHAHTDAICHAMQGCAAGGQFARFLYAVTGEGDNPRNGDAAGCTAKS